LSDDGQCDFDGVECGFDSGDTATLFVGVLVK